MEKILSRRTLVIVLLVFTFAFLLRFLWLGNITQIYFDEAKYLFDAVKYQQGMLSFERYNAAVPQHPLLSLMFMQYGISAFGFNYLGWRFFSVLFGAMSVAVFYLLVKKLFTERAALIAALLLSVDFLHLALSRIAMIDIYLIFFLLSAFYFLSRSLKHERSEGLLLAGTFFGLALAIQWPSAFGILSGLIIYYALSQDPKKISKGLIRLLLYPAFLYIAVLLLLNLSAGTNAFSWMRFEINNFMYHSVILFQPAYNASALTWPLLLRSTPMFISQMGENLVRVVIAFGNPAVYWLMVPVFLFLINEYQNRKEKDPSVLFVLIGFFGMYLPWLIYEALVKLYVIAGRGLFFYYFLPAVPFYIAALASLLDRWLDTRVGRIVVPVYLAIVLAMFIYFSPIIYGFPVTPDYISHLKWLPGWIP